MAIPSLIKEIDSLKKELAVLLPMSDEQQQKLDKKFRLEFHYNSNHIEGNTLTYGETELLLIFDETRGNHTLREYEEMKASDVTLQLIEKEAENKEQPLTESFIKNLNKVLLVRPYYKEAITPDGQPTRRKILVGDYKKHPNSVRLENGEIFSYASPQETPIQMGELMEWYKAELETQRLHPVELAAQLHYKFVRIHPFDDGNGRISRLLMNYVLFYFDYPLVVIKSNDKRNYLSALHDADTGNLESFENYVAEQLIWSLQLSIKAAKGENIDEDEDWKKRIALTRKQLENAPTLTAIKSISVLALTINKEILPLLSSILISMKNISDMFLESYTLIDAYSRHFRNKEAFSEQMVEDYFDKDLKAILMFKNFTKNKFNSFSLELDIKFVFAEHHYDVFIRRTKQLSKFYDHPFTEFETNDLINRCGTIITNEIEERLMQ